MLSSGSRVVLSEVNPLDRVELPYEGALAELFMKISAKYEEASPETKHRLMGLSSMMPDTRSTYDLDHTIGGVMMSGSALLNDASVCEFCKDAEPFTIG